MESSCILSSVASTRSVSDLGYLYGCRLLQQGGATLGFQESWSSKNGIRIFSLKNIQVKTVLDRLRPNEK